MYENEGGGSSDVGFFRDVGDEMPADPDNPGEHYGEQPLYHLGATFQLGPALGRVEFRNARAAALQSFAAFDAFMGTSSAAGWYAGRPLDQQRMLWWSALKRE